jgi:Bacterial Ig domain/Right handed beta helix region
MTHTPGRPPDRWLLVARWRRRTRLPVAVLGALAALAPVASAADLNATPANLSSVFASAQGGDVIHLAGGSYGSFKGASKPSTVTLVAQAGATPTMDVNFSPADHIRLDGLTVNGGTLNGAHDIAIVNSRFTGLTTVAASLANANILFDHDTFDGINVCSNCPEGRLTVRGYENAQPVGVAVTNSHFGNGGNSDGIQIIGGANGVQIGPGNEFSGLTQVDATHTDAIQLYGSKNTLITGNWLHGNETGIMAPDGSDHETITNNVISTTSYPWGVVLGAANGTTVTHNTLPGGSGGGTIEVDKSNGGASSSGVIVTDNVAAAVTNASGGSALGVSVQDYNLIPGGGSGAHSLKAKPVFSAGAGPTSFAGYLLAAGSPGVKAASDGKDIGIYPIAGPPAAPAPVASPSGAAAPAGVPRISLMSPVPGARFTSHLRMAARVSDNSGINRVGFWFDGHWIGTARKAPYKMSWRVTKGTKFRSHTVTLRAFAADGQVSSRAVTVRRVHRGAGARAAASSRRGWRLASSPGANGTTLRGGGRPRHKLVVTLTRCADPSARAVKRLRLRAQRDGKIRAQVAKANLCVLRLQPV